MDLLARLTAFFQYMTDHVILFWLGADAVDIGKVMKKWV